MKKIFLLLFLNLINLYAVDVVLKLPTAPIPSFYDYLNELIKIALENNNVTYRITNEEVTLPKSYNLLETGELSAIMAFKRKEMNEKYVLIPFGLTNNLIGKRILLIPKGQQYIYDNVKTLDDFRNLKKVGVFGEGWQDIKIWEKNNLLYLEKIGNSDNIFQLVANRKGYDYFSRAASEIVAESKKHPTLDIEKNLILTYDYDFNIYLSTKGEFAGVKYKDILEESLLKADRDGLVEKLKQKYWGKDLEALNLDDRIVIELEMP